MGKSYKFLVILLAMLVYSLQPIFSQCTVEITNLDPTYCIDDDAVEVTLSPEGGVLSGNGISGTTFDPAAAGIGTHEIIYQFSSSTGYNVSTGITFSPVSISGTQVYLSDEQISNPLPIGFNFNFYNNSYTNFYISSNGFITFSSNDAGCCSGQLIPKMDTPNDLIAFAWEDLNPSNGGAISYTTIGSAPNRVLVVEFLDVPHFNGGGGNVTAQVLLYETTNAIEIHTTSMLTDGGTHTMGIENIDGTDAVAVPGRNASSWSITNDAVRFVPAVDCEDSDTVNVEVTGDPGEVFLSTDTLEFGEIFLGLTSQQTLNMYDTNTCSYYTVTALSSDSSQFVYADLTPFDVVKNSDVDLAVTFIPNTAGDYYDTLFIMTSVVDTFIILHGIGLSAPIMSVDTSNFETIINGCDANSTLSFMVDNSEGEADLEFEIIGQSKINESFDNTFDNHWDLGVDLDIEISDNGLAEDTACMQISGLSTIEAGADLSFIASTPDYISFSVKPDINSSSNSFISIGDENLGADDAAIRILFDNTMFGPMFVIYGFGPYKVDPNKWYQFEIVNIRYESLDCYYDLRINGDLVGENILFWRNKSYLSNIRFFNDGEDATWFVDNIVVGKQIEWVQAVPQTGTISPGESQQINLQISTENLIADNYYEQLYVSSNSPYNPMDTIDLYLEYNGTPAMELSKASSDLGEVYQYADVVDSIIIENLGCAELNIYDLNFISDNFFADIIIESKGLPGPGGYRIPAGEKGILIISPETSEKGLFLDTLQIISNESIVYVPVQVNVIGKPEIELSHLGIQMVTTGCGVAVDSVISIANVGEDTLRYQIENTVTSSSQQNLETESSNSYYYGFDHLPSTGENIQLTVTVLKDPNLVFPMDEIEVEMEGDIIGYLHFNEEGVATDTFDIAPGIYLNDRYIEVRVANQTFNGVLEHYVTLSVAYESWLSVAPVNGEIATDVSDDITLTANPIGLPVGEYTEYIKVVSNDLTTGTQVLPVTLIVEGEPVIDISGDCIAFGSVVLADSASRMLDIANTGCDTLKITDINGVAEAWVIDTTHTIYPFSETQVEVWYKPATADVIDGNSISIVSNAGTVDVCLTGIGVATPGDIAVDSTSITVNTGCENLVSFPIEISNTGDADINYSVTMNNFYSYMSASQTAGILVPTGVDVIELTFDGSALTAGTYVDEIVINSDDPDEDVITIPVSFIVDQDYASKAEIANITTEPCEGESYFLSADNPDAGTYTWNTGETGTPILIDTSGTYILTYEDINGCLSYDTVDITFHIVTVDLGADVTACRSDEVILDAGNSGSEYLWSNGESNQTLNVEYQDTYIVEVTDIYGCSNSDTVEVSFNENPVVNLGEDLTDCIGTEFTLDAGNAGATFAWSNAETTQSIIVAESGIYAVEVTDNNNCSTTDAIEVTTLSLPAVELGADVNACTGDDIVLDAGTDAIAYMWSGGETTQTLSVAGSGEYYVDVTGANGCMNSDTIVVTINTLPVVDLGADQADCAGTTFTLDAGNAGATYAWSGGEITQSIDVTTNGDYIVEVTDANGCVNADTVYITVYELPVVNLGADMTMTTGDKLMLNPGVFESYSWSTSETTQTIMVDCEIVGVGQHTYSVVVANQNGCEGTDDIMITVESGADINDVSFAENINLYPNPADDVINLAITESMHDVDLSLIAVDGRVVYQSHLTHVNANDILSIDVSKLSAGLYVLHFNIDMEQHVMQVVIN